MNQRWQIIPYTENSYAASTSGNIARVYQDETGILRIQKILNTKKPDSNGYLVYGLSIRGSKVRYAKGHQLVAAAFMDHKLTWYPDYDPNADIEINHVNKDRTDNRVINLEKVTRKKNLIHRDKYDPSDLEDDDYINLYYAEIETLAYKIPEYLDKAIIVEQIDRNSAIMDLFIEGEIYSVKIEIQSLRDEETGKPLSFVP